MDDIIAQITRKATDLLHGKVDFVEKKSNVLNNSVYKISVAGKPYIFKIYKQHTWPEDGKLLFVNQKLIEHRMNCAKMITFDRQDSYFQNGFLIEEYLPGLNAGDIHFDSGTRDIFYKKLAQLISKIHEIRIENFGYIGRGVAGYPSFTEFMADKYDEITNALTRKKILDEKALLELKKPVMDRLRLCEELPSVLNHGDLSTKNVMVDEHGDLTLIDWDDAMSYNWIADVARMTYWMKFNYHEHDYQMCRTTFMEHYSSGNVTVDFDAFENVFHVWIGLDHLNYFANTTPEFEKAMNYFKETMDKLV